MSRGDGKELCDLMVVFKDTIIIFSDKDCVFRESGDIDVSWGRWYKRAIEKSAHQIFGAEKWIRDHQDNIFIDRKCTKPLPVPLPSRNRLRIHRIVVAHGAAKACQAQRGGSGSLMLDSNVSGEAHYLKSSDGGKPFTVGHVKPDKGFVHVLDDTTLPLVLKQLDTISDFIDYLERKEVLFASGRHIAAAGKEELLAAYLSKTNTEHEHDFIIPDGATVVTFPEGRWKDFDTHPQHLAQIEADRISYFWDDLIERSTRHALAGTSEWQSEPGLHVHELALRVLASECRLRRRLLSNAFIGLKHNTKRTQRTTRIVKPYLPEQPYYIFLLLPYSESDDYEVYRKTRREMLQAYCQVLKADFSDAKEVIGIATESGLNKYSSEDLGYADFRDWTEMERREAMNLKRQMMRKSLIRERIASSTKIEEYPTRPAPPHPAKIFDKVQPMNGNNRNMLCPCGSQKKYKKCCGPLLSRRSIQ